ncbi:hypothetical protein LIER_11520 [Lithospermum erythrorhizon]|uniref:Uncharacterized protein n=1 Tax=Lithospermum erythrorhizon TaxID=34254 RepID=A0AAV3PND6_LITER
MACLKQLSMSEQYDDYSNKKQKLNDGEVIGIKKQWKINLEFGSASNINAMKLEGRMRQLFNGSELVCYRRSSIDNESDWSGGGKSEDENFRQNKVFLDFSNNLDNQLVLRFTKIKD